MLMNSIIVEEIFIDEQGSGRTKPSHKSWLFETLDILQFNLQNRKFITNHF
jgi:hypothetical protein